MWTETRRNIQCDYSTNIKGNRCAFCWLSAVNMFCQLFLDFQLAPPIEFLRLKKCVYIFRPLLLLYIPPLSSCWILSHHFNSTPLDNYYKLTRR
jgi:hypothetical protein